MLFSLVLQPVIHQINEQVPELSLNAWYLDDGTQVGSLCSLQKVVDILLKEGPARGLHLSTNLTAAKGKTTLWSPSIQEPSADPMDRGIPVICEEGIILLGAPVGSLKFTKEALKERSNKAEKLVGLLPNMKDPHSEFVLLRSCLSLPKIMFNLRTLDTSPHSEILMAFDNMIREALNRILGTALDENAWNQAKLPVSMGGLGLRAALDHAPAAFISSHLAAGEIIHKLTGESSTTSSQSSHEILDALENLSVKVGETVTKEDIELKSQKEISLGIDLYNQDCLLKVFKDSFSLRDQARMSSLTLPHAGDWLNTAPILSLGLHLRHTEFIPAVRYRLGVSVYDSDGPCPACQKLNDKLGDHALHCGHTGERISRHNHLRDIIHETAAAAALSPSKEDRFLIPGEEVRPADVLLPYWENGQDTAIDVTVISSLQQATVASAAVTPGHALNFAYAKKMDKAGDSCRAQGIGFVPFVVEALGGFHSAAVRQVRKLGAALARHNGQPEEEASRHLFQRLSITIQKGNSSMITNRKRNFPSPETDGDL